MAAKVKPKYTFKDWLIGKVYLDSSPIAHNKGDKLPKNTNWTDFLEKDIKLIKLHQKKIFESASQHTLKHFIETFKNRLKNSETKELLLKLEIKDNWNILFKEPIHNIRLKNRDIIFLFDDLVTMRDFISRNIIKGEKNYDFVHSSSFKFQNKKHFELLTYTRAVFDYYKWLLKFKPKTQHKNVIKIPVKVIALMCIYKDLKISEDTFKKIAKKYGYTNKTSWKGLLDDYYKFYSKNSRQSLNDESITKCKNRLKLIQLAASKLRGKAKIDALNDANILDNLIKKHNWQ